MNCSTAGPICLGALELSMDNQIVQATGTTELLLKRLEAAPVQLRRPTAKPTEQPNMRVQHRKADVQ